MKYLITTNTNSTGWLRRHPWTPKKLRGLTLYVDNSVKRTYVTDRTQAKRYAKKETAKEECLRWEQVMEDK